MIFNLRHEKHLVVSSLLQYGPSADKIPTNYGRDNCNFYIDNLD